MITACARTKDEAKARATMQRVRDMGLRPDVIAYTALLATLWGPDSLAKAEGVVREMQAEHIAPDSFIYNALLRIAVECKAPERFNELLAEMDARGLPRNRETELRLYEHQMLLNSMREQEEAHAMA